MKGHSCLFVLATLLACGCAREVVIDLPEEEPKVVAICHFTEGEHFKVNISLSQEVNDGSDPEFPGEVDVTLSVNGQFYDALYRERGVGNTYYWKSHKAKIPREGIRYNLDVRVPGYPVAEAGSSIPRHYGIGPFQILTSDLQVSEIGNGMNELRIPIELKLDELPDHGRYFAFFLNHDMQVYESLSPPVADYTKEQVPTNFLSDGRTISLLHNIPEPVVLVNENYWDDNRKSLFLTARIPYDPDTERPKKLYISWRTLSEEFYRYHLSLSRQGGNLPLSDPDAVFNNVEGGLGNFSGYSIAIDTIAIPGF